MRELDFGDYNDKLSRSGCDLLAHAIEESRRRDQNYLAAEHLFLAAVKIERKLLETLMSELRLAPANIVHDVSKRLELSKQYTGKGLKITFSVKSIFRLAWIQCFQDGRSKIQSYDLLGAIFQEGNNIPVEIFRLYGVEPEKADRALKELKERKLINVEPEKKENKVKAEFPEDKKQAVRNAVASNNFQQAHEDLCEFYSQQPVEWEGDDLGEQGDSLNSEEELDLRIPAAGLKSYAYGILFAGAALLLLAILIRSLLQFISR